MNMGQMSMMPANAGVATLGSAQPSSSPAAVPDSGGLTGGLFSGLLEGLTLQGTSPGAAVPPSAGKDATAAENSGGTVTTAAVQDDPAGASNALDATGKPLAEPGAGIRTTANGSGRKPQDAALNADALRMALLIQMNSGGMQQPDDTVAPQATGGTGEPSASATAGDAETPAPVDASGKKPQDVALNADGMQMAQMIQANNGRMPQPDDTVAPQAVDAAAGVAPLSGNGGAPGGSAATDGDANGLKQGLSSLAQGSEPQHAPPEAALPSQQVSAIAAQKSPAAGNDTVSTERGTAADDRKGGTSDAGQVSPSPVTEGAATRVAAFSGVEVTVQPQQQATLFRSAPLEAAPAESVPQNGARTTGQTQDDSSAQNTPVEEVPAVSAGKTPQAAVQQGALPAQSGPTPESAALSQAPTQQPDHADDRTLAGAKPAQAAGMPAAEKTGADAGGEAVQARPESTVAAKPVQTVAAEAAKFIGTGSSGAESGAGDDKGTADNAMNGQFHATLMHQQGAVDGANAPGSAALPVQGATQQSGLSEQILQQVKDRFANHEVKAGTDQIVLKLSPENLGDLKVNLTMDGQRLKVEIVAENHMVRDALLQNTDSLKESLARQHISMESFDVTTNGRGAGNPGQGQQQNAWREFAQQRQQNAWMSSGGYRLPDAAPVPSQVTYQTPSSHTMVDLHF